MMYVRYWRPLPPLTWLKLTRPGFGTAPRRMSCCGCRCQPECLFDNFFRSASTCCIESTRTTSRRKKSARRVLLRCRNCRKGTSRCRSCGRTTAPDQTEEFSSPSTAKSSTSPVVVLFTVQVDVLLSRQGNPITGQLAKRDIWPPRSCLILSPQAALTTFSREKMRLADWALSHWTPLSRPRTMTCLI